MRYLAMLPHDQYLQRCGIQLIQIRQHGGAINHDGSMAWSCEEKINNSVDKLPCPAHIFRLPSAADRCVRAASSQYPRITSKAGRVTTTPCRSLPAAIQNALGRAASGKDTVRRHRARSVL